MTTVQRALGRAVESVFGTVARVRAGRALHSVGVAFDGRLTLDPDSLFGAAVGGAPGRPAVVRLSKSVGLPGGLPDLLGVALRVPAGDGRIDGEDDLFDLLLASTGRHRPAHLALLPSGRWWGSPYSTLLPYRARGRLVLLGLDAGDAPRTMPADPGTAAALVAGGRVRMAVTELPLRDALGHPRVVGELVLESVRDPAQPPITFDPVLNHLPDLHPARPLTALRERAYTGSRRGRQAEPAGLRRRP
ncbi:hypothetical protein [Pseudonocardia humida]|uniref:Phosphodiesterase n=1 Tax=Pseudonocardia humida TaxID=2800819 RepID=A0ABT1A4F4_9PSEU|nr:hypothetical protein [Pseudonocardia humida]MCO1657845.1 hypothetical protein [Pseudonocardia humida]